MKKLKLALTPFFLLTVLHAAAPPAIVPRPTTLETHPGRAFALSPATSIRYQTRTHPRALETSLKPLANVLAGEIELITGFRPTVQPINPSHSNRSEGIVLKFTPLPGQPQPARTEPDEDQSYTLTVNPTGVLVSSPHYKGVASGGRCLLLLSKRSG